MNKRRIGFVLLMLILAVGIVVYGRSQARNTALIQPSPQRPDLKQHEIYEQMFRDYAVLQKKANDEERVGRNGYALRTFYNRQANLTEQQASQLEAVASDCVDELTKLDARAKQVIDEARARVPGGQLKRGETPPPAPVELTTLQQARETKVRQAINSLRTSYGDGEFTRFDEFVQRTIAANMKLSSPGEHNLIMRPLQRHQ